MKWPCRRALLLLLALVPFAGAQRLPHLAIPENYTLSFTPNFEAETFAGDETIQIRVLEPTNRIVLNAAEIDFKDTRIRSGDEEQNATVAADEQNETAVLTVEHALQPGPATIHIRYQGILGRNLRGFYLGTNEQGQSYAVTQFESTDARRAYPSFDEPAYKAAFDITVTAPRGMVAISNTPVLSDTQGPAANQHTVRFATTPKMSSYLAAIAVGQFEYVEGSADGVPIRVYTTPGRKQLANFALESAENILRYYDQYFAIKYPYQKLDLIALPDFAAGAMENTACITFRETLLLLDEQRASLAQRKRVASVVAHEMAHQWFGDLVTMQWWDDVWLNEGFATWMSSKPLQAWKPEWNVQLDDVRDSLQALNLDSLANTRPIHQAVETPSEILGLFDAIAYEKAAAVLRMLEAYLGPETFQRGVNLYLKEHAQNNATAEDFWNALARASRKPVDAIMSTFIRQPGPPLVSLTNRCVGNVTAVDVVQRRYFYDRTKFAAGSEKSDPELWKIPVCMKAPSAHLDKTQTACRVLSAKEEKFNLPGCAGWVFGNADAKGYYRSGYQPRAEHAMADAVETALTPAERMMLLNDVWASVRVGREPIGDYLDLAESLRTEKSPDVMRQLLLQLDFIGAYLLNANGRWAYRLWVRHLLAPIAEQFGSLPATDASDDQKLLRGYVLRSLGITAGDSEVLTEGDKWAKRALENPESADPEMTPIFFNLAAASGDAAFFDELLASLRSNNTPEQYNLYLKTLAEFTDSALLRRTLDYAVSSAVRSQDAAQLVAGVLQNPAGRNLAWNFVHSHWQEIAGKGGPFASGALVKAAGFFCDAAKEEDVKEFFSSHRDLTEERVLNQSLERIGYCVDLKTHQSQELAVWLQQHDGATQDNNQGGSGSPHQPTTPLR